MAKTNSLHRSAWMLICCLFPLLVSAQTKYVGGDISMLRAYEQHNSPYLDERKQPINDLIPWLIENCGWNTFRVRIFVNPDPNFGMNNRYPDYIDQDGNGIVDPAIIQSLAYVKALGKRIKDAGAYFMLDFHYSDFWVDAGKILPPTAWMGKNDEEMAQQLGDYTREVLTELNNYGATPDLVQVGNEIMYGLCSRKVHPYDTDGDNWPGYIALLQAGCNAVRELCPDAKIIIHTDRPTNTGFNRYYYQKLVDNDVDFDVIGLSYYPFWHGYLTVDQVRTKSDKNYLVKAINQLATDFPTKRVQIVETAYYFQYWPNKGINYNTQDVWPCTKAGQYQFIKDLVDALMPLPNLDGINYWFPEEAGNGDDTNYSTSKGTVIHGWLNRGLFDDNKVSGGHPLNVKSTPTAGQSPADVSAAHYMGKFVGFVPQGVEEILSSPAKSDKFLSQDGQILIRKNNKLYHLLGCEVH